MKSVTDNEWKACVLLWSCGEATCDWQGPFDLPLTQHIAGTIAAEGTTDRHENREVLRHGESQPEFLETSSRIWQARTQGRGGVHWVHVHPPTWEKSSAQKCPKEERKFLPDMSAKKNVHVPLRYDKIKTKMVGKKREKSKRKAEGLSQWLRSLPPNPEVPGSISRPGRGLNIWVTFFPAKVHSAFHPSGVGKISTSIRGLI